MVADDANNKPGPFDLSTLKALAALMSRHDLSELDLSDGDRRLRLRRGLRITAAAASNAPILSAPSTASPSSPPAEKEPEKPARTLLEIKSNMIGTFYNREKPEAPPYVSVGSRVTPRTIVGLLEAMKLFNEVYAECNGVVAEVLVENAQFVEYGQVLFRVDPTA
jgi:acetyl-CoA carboxylase biotin carboxyl carrier protein